jgi:tRNA pseudouridine55 synthase
MPSGILLLDKPQGLTSNGALQRVRRAFGADSAGHVGTLDPMATGMLPICLDEATKVIAEIESGAKARREMSSRRCRFRPSTSRPSSR